MLKVLKSTLAIGLIASMIACSTTWVTEAENILAVVTPAVVNVLTLIAAFEGRPVNATQVATLTNDVNASIQLVKDYAAASAAAQPGALAQLDAALSTTQKDLSSILADVHITDARHAAEVTALVTFVISEVAAVQSLIPTPAVTPAAAPKRAQKVPLSAKQFKKAFNALMKQAAPALVIK